MTSQDLAAGAGIVLSLLLSYVPGLRDKYDKLDSTSKSLVMVGLLLVVSIAVFALSCYNVIAAVQCTTASAWELAKIFIAALIANQAAYVVSPRPDKVKKSEAPL